MSNNLMAVINGRTIPKEDKIFSINGRAKAMIAEKGKEQVVNGTIGALLDDEGNLMVLPTVEKVFKSLTADEYCAYAPIAGSQEFRQAVIESALLDFQTQRHVRAVATPGGTGALKNAIANYSKEGDSVLTADWFWSPYGTIAGELGRNVETFPLFDDAGKFNQQAFKAKMMDLGSRQSHIVVILNTPAHNPTGYALDKTDWEGIKTTMEEMAPNVRVALVIDTAYIDFAGDEKEYRQFFAVVEQMPENVLPMIAHSMSKTFTMYGMRCGAIICLASSEAVAEEFDKVCQFSSRASWSNCSKAGQSVIARIYQDDQLKEAVSKEREQVRDMLLERGKAFEDAAKKVGLPMVPFDGGFFASIPTDNANALATKLEKEGIFLVPLAKGLRVSIASVPKWQCEMLPEKIKAAMDTM